MHYFFTRHVAVLFILTNIIFYPLTVSGNPYQINLKTQAVENKLHTNKAWLSLLHYRKDLFTEQYQSEADNPKFFFSPKGKNNPQSELMATIDAMFLPKSLGDEHPQCSFPARFAFLKKHLKINPVELQNPDCECLRDWIKKMNSSQVTIVFPTAYLNNPSSMFGHLFMRFEPSDMSAEHHLMAYTINFAADTSSQEGVVDYIYRGLFGGFPSNNSIRRFYERLKRYSDIENRDIWEYTLNLSNEEMDLLIFHVWELKNKVFNYYFLDENCAYRLIALLEVARPDINLTQQFHIYTIPGDVIRALKNRGAIQSSIYRPSAIKTFYHHITYLNQTESQIVFDIVRKNLSLDDTQILSLPPERKALALALASEYLALLINKDMLDRKLSMELSHHIFTERIKHSLPVTFNNVPIPASSPDNGHKAHRISVGGGCDKNNMFFSLHYRNVYHSLLDPLPGYEKGAQVEFFNINLRGYENDGLLLEQLELLNIKSLSPFNMFFKPASWKFSIGAERRDFNSKNSLVEYIEGGMGATIELGACMLSGMAHFELDFGSALDDGYGISSGLYLDMVYQSETYSYELGLLSMKYLYGDNDFRTKLWGKVCFPLSKNNAFYSQIEYTPNCEGKLYDVVFGIHHYF